jgi:hypothetical protein
MKTLLVLLPLVLAPQDGKVQLRWKWEKGRELLYRNVQTQSVEAAGAAMQQEMGLTYRMTVEEVDEAGTATLRVRYEAMAAKGSGLMEFEYDSDKDKEAPEDPQVAAMTKLIGQSFTMKMTPTGRVTSIEGFGKIVELLLKELKGHPQAAFLQGVLKETFSDEAMKSTFQQMTPALPEQAVGKGDSWKDAFTFRMPMIGAMKYGIASTLDGVQDGRAAIKQDYTVEMKADEKPDPDSPFAQAGLELKESKGKAEVVFSTADGALVSQKTDLVMIMVVKAAGQEIPVHTRNEMKRVEGRKKF